MSLMESRGESIWVVIPRTIWTKVSVLMVGVNDSNLKVHTETSWKKGGAQPDWHLL